MDFWARLTAPLMTIASNIEIDKLTVRRKYCDFVLRIVDSNLWSVGKHRQVFYIVCSRTQVFRKSQYEVSFGTRSDGWRGGAVAGDLLGPATAALGDATGESSTQDHH